MSTKPEPVAVNTPDGPTRESRRQEFRKLLILLLGALAVSWAAEFFAPVSERFIEASDAEIETIPEWRFYTGIAAGLILMGVFFFGVYRLWKYKADGMGYLSFAVFFPSFLVLPITLSSSAFAYYVGNIQQIVIGIVLYACWSSADLFDQAPGAEAEAKLAVEANTPAGSTTP